MTDTDAFSDLKKTFDNISKALDGFYNELPKYLRNEMLHPKKKPRGSMRRARKERGGANDKTGSRFHRFNEYVR